MTLFLGGAGGFWLIEGGVPFSFREILAEDSAEFFDALAIFIDAVAGGHGYFGGCHGQVGTPVGDNSIRAEFDGAWDSAVSNDGVQGDLMSKGEVQDGEQERGIGAEKADAVVWEAEDFLGIVPHDTQQLETVFSQRRDRQADDVCEKAGERSEGKRAVSVRGHHKNHPVHVPPGGEIDQFFDDLPDFGLHFQIINGELKEPRRIDKHIRAKHGSNIDGLAFPPA